MTVYKITGHVICLQIKIYLIDKGAIFDDFDVPSEFSGGPPDSGEEVRPGQVLYFPKTRGRGIFAF